MSDRLNNSNHISNANELISTARNAWGHEAAKRVLRELIDSICFANDAIDPHDSVKGFQVQIVDIPDYENGRKIPRVLGLHTKYDGFGLVLDATDTKGVLAELRSTVVHETARVEIFQHRTGIGEYDNNDENSLFDDVVESGMVVYATEKLLEHSKEGDEDMLYTSYHLGDSVIIPVIAELLKDLNSHDDSLHDALFGDPQFPRKGYKVGHAIVRSAAESHNLTIKEVLHMSRQFYQEHARVMVSLYCK